MDLDTSLVAPPNTGPSASSSGTQQNPPSRIRKQPLNSSDPLYASLRDINFAIVGTVLNRVARRLSEDYEVPSPLCSLLTLGTTPSQDCVPDKRIREQVDGITSRASITATTFLPYFSRSLISDTNLAEDIMTYTSKQNFNRALEVQQSTFIERRLVTYLRPCCWF